MCLPSAQEKQVGYVRCHWMHSGIQQLGDLSEYNNKKKQEFVCFLFFSFQLWEIGEKSEATSTEEPTAFGIGTNSNCKVNFIASLKRHCKSVNVVRWHPGGEILASAGDEACIFLWKENEVKNQKTLDMDEDENKENWFSYKTLR